MKLIHLEGPDVAENGMWAYPQLFHSLKHLCLLGPLLDLHVSLLGNGVDNAAEDE